MIYSIAPVLVRSTVLVDIPKSAVDTAGYRPIAAMVDSFNRAGVQLDIFRAAEFEGDLDISPLHRQYIDPVDRDEALLAALDRAKQAKSDFERARKVALDKRRVERENEIIRIAERLKGVRDGKVSFEAPEPPAEGSPTT